MKMLSRNLDVCLWIPEEVGIFRVNRIIVIFNSKIIVDII